jgi:4-diphosphocytidyl-2-C-methyl-D-erythritol kinase
MPLPLRALAPAKVNLGLFVGPLRADGRHEVTSVMQSISLADELTLDRAPAGVERDEVLCAGVQGENLAARALALFRETSGWAQAPLRLEIDKRIPVAAGLGGGSADAAAALRLASAASGLGDESLLLGIARELGADVPAQISPGRWLARGAGELLQPLPPPSSPLAVLVLASDSHLSTANVYAAADRLATARDADSLARRNTELRLALDDGQALPAAASLLDNDLQGAAIALCPSIEQSLARVQRAGAEIALVSGSGPTVIGLFRGPDALDRAQRAAQKLAGCTPAPIVTETVQAEFAQVTQPGVGT